MFDSLDEQIKHDTMSEPTSRERILRWIAVAIAAALMFAGLYLGLRLLE